MNTERYENLLSEILETAELGLSNGSEKNPYALHNTNDSLVRIVALVERHQQHSFQERFDSMVDDSCWKDELDV